MRAFCNIYCFKDKNLIVFHLSFSREEFNFKEDVLVLNKLHLIQKYMYNCIPLLIFILETNFRDMGRYMLSNTIS